MANLNTSRDIGNSSLEDRADRITTAQMNALYPEEGRTIYNTDDNVLMFYDGTQWLALVSTEYMENYAGIYRAEQGWGIYANSNYTHLAPFAVAEGNTTLLDFNAADSVETHLPGDVTSFLDPATNTFTPVGLNSVYMFNLFVEASSSANDGLAFFEIYSNGNKFRDEVMNFAKGANTHQGFNFSSTQVVSQPILDNGFNIRFKAEVGSLELHDIKLTITKLFHGV